MGWSLSLLAGSFVAFAGCQILAAFLSGLIADRCGALMLLQWILLPQAAALLSLVFLAPATGLWLFMGFSGLAYGMTATLATLFLPEIYGTKHLGSLKALIESAMICATAASPVILGWLFDAGFTVSELVWSGLMFLPLAQFALLLADRANKVQLLKT